MIYILTKLKIMYLSIIKLFLGFYIKKIKFNKIHYKNKLLLNQIFLMLLHKYNYILPFYINNLIIYTFDLKTDIIECDFFDDEKTTIKIMRINSLYNFIKMIYSKQIYINKYMQIPKTIIQLNSIYLTQKGINISGNILPNLIKLLDRDNYFIDFIMVNNYINENNIDDNEICFCKTCEDLLSIEKKYIPIKELENKKIVEVLEMIV